MARKAQRTSRNSAAGGVSAFAGGACDVPIPAGVELPTDAERVLWSQFTRARARSDWRDLDLILLAKVVSIEATLRGLLLTWKTQGALIENKRGTAVENPLLRVIDTLQRQQLAVIRSMSLTQMGSDAREVNRAGLAESEAKRLLQKEGPAGLLAMPVKH